MRDPHRARAVGDALLRVSAISHSGAGQGPHRARLSHDLARRPSSSVTFPPSFLRTQEPSASKPWSLRKTLGPRVTSPSAVERHVAGMTTLSGQTRESFACDGVQVRRTSALYSGHALCCLYLGARGSPSKYASASLRLAPAASCRTQRTRCAFPRASELFAVASKLTGG